MLRPDTNVYFLFKAIGTTTTSEIMFTTSGITTGPQVTSTLPSSTSTGTIEVSQGTGKTAATASTPGGQTGPTLPIRTTTAAEGKGLIDNFIVDEFYILKHDYPTKAGKKRRGILMFKCCCIS